MRDRFVFMLDIDIHNELHNAILHDIPRPTTGGLAAMYLAAREHKDEIANMDIVQAAEWLTEACYDEPYHTCMAYQATFLKQKLGK